MAAPTFVGAGAGVIAQTGSAAVTAAGSGVAIGDLVVLQVLQDGVAASAVTYSAISGIANLAGTASSLTVLATDQVVGSTAKQHLRVGRATSTTCSVTVATTGDDLYYRLYVFRNVDTGAALTNILENGTAGTIVNGSGATAAVADTGVTTLGADRFALNLVAVDDDNPVASFTGMTGGAWAEAVAEFASATGTDGAIQLQISEIGASAAAREEGNYRLLGFSALNRAVAAPFTAQYTGTLTNVSFTATTQGAPTDDVLVEIRPDASGSPSGTAIGTTVTVNVAGAAATYVAAVNAPITSGTPYWIVFIKSVDLFNAIDYYKIEASATGAYKAYDGTTWTAPGGGIGYVLSGSGAAGTINGGSFTMAAADNWGVIGLALIPPPSGPATLERNAALAAVGLIATIGRELLARLVALNAAGAVASSGVKVTPGVTYERSVALAATGTVAASGISVVPGRVAINATATITAVGRETLARAAAVTATASIASAGREQLARLAELAAATNISVSGVRVAGGVTVQRSAAIAATGSISTVGRETLTRSAALAASAGIATTGRELLPRAAVVTAAASIAAVGRKSALRSTSLTATAAVTAVGDILGAAQRSAQVAATAAVSASGTVMHVRQRSAALAVVAAVTSVPQRAIGRAATVTGTAAVTSVGRKLLVRTSVLDANAAITTVAGGNVGQASLAAIATITTTLPLPAGAISSSTTGHVWAARRGGIQAGSEGEIAAGADGVLARTGG